MVPKEPFEHGGFHYALTWGSSDDENLTVTIQCTRGGRKMWSQRVVALVRQDALMPRAYWKVRDGVVTLHTDGEHWRGATSHQRRLHSMSHVGFIGSEDLPDPDYHR